MANFNASQKSGAQKLIDTLQAHLKSEGTGALGGTTNLKQMIALESADSGTIENVFRGITTDGQGIKGVLQSLANQAQVRLGRLGYGTATLGMEDFDDFEGDNVDNEGDENRLTAAQLQAGAIAAAAMEDPAAYAKAALSVSNAGEDTAIGDNVDSGGYDSDSAAVALEAYDATAIRTTEAYSIVYNVVSARQSALPEMFYETVVLPPDQAGIKIYTQVQVYFQDARHQHTGKVEGFNRIHLIQAVSDHTILANDITRVVPVYQAGVNDDSFVDPAIIAPVSVNVDGINVDTLPLKPGVEFGLLGLSQAAIAGFTGELDSSDQLANGAKLDNIYVRVTNTSNVVSIVKFPLGLLGRTSFLAPPEGYDRDTLLNFINGQIPLSGDTKDITGAPALALAHLRAGNLTSHTINFKMHIAGTLNLENGIGSINNSTGTMTDVIVSSADGIYEAERDLSVVTAVKSPIRSIELIGIDLDTHRTNLNRRQRGPLTGTWEYSERYLVRLGAPISAIAPTTDTRTGSDFISPLTATRIRNDNNAITHLFSTAESLSALKITYDNTLPRAEIKALGRRVITPFYDHIQVSMQDLVSSYRSKNVPEDMRYALGNVVREAIFRGLRDSQYETALEIQSGSNNAKPVFAVGTNRVLAKHLWVQGDNRWLGEFPFDARIESHSDYRFGEPGSDTHEMFIAPVLPGTKFNPLSFGQFIWIPELATTLKVTRNGAVNNEVMVQPRTEHINLCPWLIRITVTDVAEALTTRLPMRFAF